MAGKIQLEIATPSRLIVREEVDEVEVPALDGYMGVLPRHAPLFTQLGHGVLSYKSAGKTRYMAIHGGVMEVLPDRVRVLPEEAEWAEEVDVEKVRRELSRARDLLQSHEMEIETEEAEELIARAQAQLRAYERTKTLS